MKELIKYKNYHLYPNELEELILTHGGVADVAVFGKPEPAVQELVTALVVKKEGVVGLLGRGLKTRLLANGLQGLMFSVLWTRIKEMW